MNSYFLCVTQPLNAGDLLINRLLVEELSKYGKVFVDCYNCPEDFRTLLLGNSSNIVDVYKEYGITLKRLNLIAFSKLIKRNSIALYTQSPGPLNKPTRITVKICYSIIRKTLSSLNVSFVRIGCCCSTAIYNNTNVIEGKRVQYYVRSTKGVDYLKQYRSGGIYYIPDLAYLYKYKVEVRPKKKIAVFSFREVTDNYELFLQWLKQCIRILSSNNYEIVFYHQVKNDRLFMEKLACLYDSESIELRKDIVWYDDFDFYSDKLIVISNRLHCLLMGAIYNAIPYAYVDNNILLNKITDVFEASMGKCASKYISVIHDSAALQDIIDNLEENQRAVAKIVDKNADLCRSTIQNIVKRV